MVLIINFYFVFSYYAFSKSSFIAMYTSTSVRKTSCSGNTKMCNVRATNFLSNFVNKPRLIAFRKYFSLIKFSSAFT